jgi:CheY-like chemotaxis protein
LLQIIQGNLSLLQRSLPADDVKSRRAVANALGGTERAAALTQRLLAFSRRQPLEPRPIDINKMIGDMTELLHRTLGETIVIETSLDRAIPYAHVDANQLENALLNLAINARDAMPHGGRLEIATRVSDFDAESPDSDAAPGRYVGIIVRDNGAGMNADVLGRAVEPFFSTKEVGQGTGLGLSMVYGFVKQSGGHMMLHSREGEGTTVELFLPTANGAPVPSSGSRALGDLPQGRGERVLLCEDDEGVRLFSGETLRDLGYEVIEAADARAALAELTEIGRVDLLFTDIVLPGGKTGADLAREARKLQPDLKVLFTTGYARSALERERQSDSGHQILLKPFGVDELAAKIREIMG